MTIDEAVDAILETNPLMAPLREENARTVLDDRLDRVVVVEENARTVDRQAQSFVPQALARALRASGMTVDQLISALANWTGSRYSLPGVRRQAEGLAGTHAHIEVSDGPGRVLIELYVSRWRRLLVVPAWRLRRRNRQGVVVASGVTVSVHTRRRVPRARTLQRPTGTSPAPS